MKFLLFFLFLSFASATSACSHATQNRLFPIGITENGLVVVELRMTRKDYFPPSTAEKQYPQIGWFGKSYLKIYSNDYDVIHEEVVDSFEKFHDLNYLQVIGKSIQKAKDLSTQFKELVPVDFLKIAYSENDEIRVKSDLENNKYVLEWNQSRYEISFFDKKRSISSNVRNAMFGEEIKLSEYTDLTVGSYRIFQVGSKKLLIAFLQNGDFEAMDDYKFDVTDLDVNCYKEPVVHHGHGFDFFTWVE